MDATLIHILYAGAAIVGYLWAHVRTKNITPIRRRVLRSGIAAVLFSPGFLWLGPFIVPTFALLALLMGLTVVGESYIFYWPQLTFSLAPMLITWAAIFLFAHVRVSICARRSKENA